MSEDNKKLPSSVVISTQVIGVPVKDKHDKSLGKIKELAIDKFEGEIKYAVLSFGGILSLGEKLFALPWKLLKYNKEKSCFIIDIDEEKLKNAEGFDEDNWPNFADPTWSNKINQYYDFQY